MTWIWIMIACFALFVIFFIYDLIRHGWPQNKVWAMVVLVLISYMMLLINNKEFRQAMYPPEKPTFVPLAKLK